MSMTQKLAFNSRTTRGTYYAGGVPPEGPDDKVGPGRYAVPDPLGASAIFRRRTHPPTHISHPTGRCAPSCAPFNSSSARSSERRPRDAALPGPGTYALVGTLDSGRRFGKGGSNAFTSQAKRTQLCAKHDSPGPGTYDIREETTRVMKSRGGELVDVETQVAAGAVVWQRLPAVPSIPTREQSYGYAEEENTGALVMQKPVVGPNTDLGPGQYDPNYDFVSAAKAKRVLSFGHAANTRPSVIAEAANERTGAPGPGHYHVELAESQVYSDRYNLRKRPTATFRSKSARDAMALSKQRHAVPGPGSYDLAKSAAEETMPVHLQCFGSTSERMPDPNSAGKNAPGPGSYLLPASTFDKVKTAKDKKAWKDVGFASSATRFVQVAKQLSSGANKVPAAYDIPGFTDEILRRPQNRRHGFGSSLKRFAEITRPHSQDPAHFSVGESQSGLNGVSPASATPSRKKRPRRKMKLHFHSSSLRPGRSSFFASATNRFPVRKKDSSTEAIPPPGAYNPDYAGDRDKKGVPLASGPKDRFHDAAGRLKLGPGRYNLPSAFDEQKKKWRRNRKNILVCASERFSERPDAMRDLVPGPGAYDPDLLYGSLIKPTSNILIAEQSTGVLLR